jgi:hypothetical protein
VEAKKLAEAQWEKLLMEIAQRMLG